MMNFRSSIWRNVPCEYRSVLRALINSDQIADRERAQAECPYYGLDYDAERRRILAEMIEEGKALQKRQEQAREKASKQERY